ncbi:hypothetical protein ACIOJF_15035 [Glutamicibacter sp. NPDC087831]|uniref:hypothetical protein n=1 Tax=Glutamicibacter sp. NPDC087831 TaxID=3363998 RepID=UPI0037F51353
MFSNEIIVFCDSGSTKHGARRPNPVVQGFYYRDGRESELGLGWTDSNRSKRLKREQAHHDAAQALYGNERFSREKQQSGERRESWNLRCLKCGFRVPVRHEKLYPALSKMRELGIQTIGLSAFRDGLENTQ